jgi:hypothetical protein
VSFVAITIFVASQRVFIVVSTQSENFLVTPLYSLSELPYKRGVTILILIVLLGFLATFSDIIR